MNKLSRRQFLSKSAFGIGSALFASQLPVDLVSLVRDRLSLCPEPLVFFVRSGEAVGTARNCGPAKPILVNGDLDIPIRRLRGRELLHVISFCRVLGGCNSPSSKRRIATRSGEDSS